MREDVSSEGISLEEFKKRVSKVTGPHIHKIRNSWGVDAYYRFYRKNRPRDPEYVLTESQYCSIIRGMNNLIRDALAMGEETALPCRMGKLEIRKSTVFLSKKGGRIRPVLRIDWPRTLELWYSDPEAYKDRIPVLIEEKERFQIHYNRSGAKYKNRAFYKFSPNRELRRKLNRNISEGIVDAYTFSN